MEAHLSLGNTHVYLLSDGVSYWDGGGTFGLVGRAKWVKLLPPDEHNLVPQALRCALIEANGKRILVDCGVGDKPNDLIATQYDVRRPNGTLLDDLARLDLAPEDIDLVILTHLHGDHSGWATRLENGRPVPTFPRARYLVQRTEFEDAIHPNERTRNTYFADNFVPLFEHGVLVLLDGEAQVSPQVRVVPTPGHTAGHQSVVIEDNAAEQPCFLTGDLAPYMIHLVRLPWVTAYDVLPMLTIETKRHWQPWLHQHRALVVNSHDTTMPVGCLERNEKGLFSAVPIAQR
ncbi:MAG: MBL fold metallo-hydrolase [Thermoflexales bacterium]|nr:MBL fold metallo-hydrolase [Thermoflexales bacterium]MDW8394936.1 MBL fold metallo-hydrolase [Anaerolineae bacterium]